MHKKLKQMQLFLLCQIVLIIMIKVTVKLYYLKLTTAAFQPLFTTAHTQTPNDAISVRFLSYFVQDEDIQKQLPYLFVWSIHFFIWDLFAARKRHAINQIKTNVISITPYCVCLCSSARRPIL